MYEDFLSYLSSDRQVIFIEAEAIEEKMNDFIKKYRLFVKFGAREKITQEI